MALAGTALAGAAAALCLAGCANVGYYWQSVSGHLKLMNAAKPVQDWLDEADTTERVRDKLVLSQRIRSFAVAELKLPDNPSYKRYADLRRGAVVWNVVAAPEFSITLKTWCFPVTGCVGYRGYFDEKEAQAEAAQLRGQGWEAAVYPVPAYSTLGLMNWAGGDPLLSTFIHYPEGELARLLFHELAHQVVYTKDDTMFNESFAVAVERLGGERWLATQGSEAARKEYGEFDGRRRQFRALTQATRAKLKSVYDPPGMAPAARAEAKQQVMREFREQYRDLRGSWGGESARWRGYDQWVERANNATCGAQAAYDELVPGFEGLFRREGSDFRRFYDAAKQLAAQPKEQRHKALKEMAGA